MKWEYIKGFGKNYKINKLGEIYLCKSKRIAKMGVGGHGYKQVNLNNQIKLVHRLVAEQFIKNIEGKSDVNHKNGNKTDNRVSNLEWVTRSENTLHEWGNGLVDNRGEKSPHARLKREDILNIRIQYSLGTMSQHQLASLYKVSQPHIGDIILRQRWKHV